MIGLVSAVVSAGTLEGGVFVETSLDIDAADGAVLVGAQPLVHALHVKQVHAR